MNRAGTFHSVRRVSPKPISLELILDLFSSLLDRLLSILNLLLRERSENVSLDLYLVELFRGERALLDDGSETIFTNMSVVSESKMLEVEKSAARRFGDGGNEFRMHRALIPPGPRQALRRL